MSDAFSVGSGVKQGCVIAPTLFSVFIACVLDLARDTLPDGVVVNYRTDGRVFNIRRLKTKSRVKTISIVDLQYADDAAICAHSAEDLQGIITAFNKAYQSLGLSLNSLKTQVLFQPAPGQPRDIPCISVDGVPLECVDTFTYLGSCLSSNATIDAEVHHRICAASTAFGKLSRRVFTNHDISTTTKVTVYYAIVVPTLTYGSESWTTYRRHFRLFESFHQRCLRKILRISWEHRRTNISVLDEACCPSMESILVSHQLRWAGHVVRMDDSRLPKCVFYGELKDAFRAPGGPKKRYKDGLKLSLQHCNINTKSWESSARNRSLWRSITHTGVEELEKRRRELLEEKRTRRTTPPPSSPSAIFPCPTCGKKCASRIGLFSHSRTHKS